MDNLQELEKSLKALKPSRVLFNTLHDNIMNMFKDKKEFDDEDLKLISFFLDIIQAKTFKFFTKEKLEQYSQLNLASYIRTKCVSAQAANAARRLQYGIIQQKLSQLKNNPASVKLYRQEQASKEDWF